MIDSSTAPKGELILEEFLRGKWPTHTLVRAVAEHAIFLSRETVEATGGAPLFRVARARSGNRSVSNDEHRVVYDDNSAAIYAFTWSAQWPNRGKDLQYNHVWINLKGGSLEDDVQRYTALWNIVVTPSFLAKLTDTNDHVKRAVRRRAQRLYEGIPGVPDDVIDETDLPGDDDLNWPAHPFPLNAQTLKAHVTKRMNANPATNAAKSANRYGWLFEPKPASSP